MHFQATRASHCSLLDMLKLPWYSPSFPLHSHYNYTTNNYLQKIKITNTIQNPRLNPTTLLPPTDPWYNHPPGTGELDCRQNCLRLLKEYSRPSRDLNNYLDPNSDFNTSILQESRLLQKILSYT